MFNLFKKSKIPEPKGKQVFTRKEYDKIRIEYYQSRGETYGLVFLTMILALIPVIQLLFQNVISKELATVIYLAILIIGAGCFHHFDVAKNIINAHGKQLFKKEIKKK